MFSAISTFRSAIHEIRQDFSSLLRTNYMLLIGLFVTGFYTNALEPQINVFVYTLSSLTTFIFNIMLIMRVVQAKVSAQGYKPIGWKGISWTRCEARLLLSILLQTIIFLALSILLFFIMLGISKIFFFDSTSLLNEFPKYLIFSVGGILLFTFGIFYFLRTCFNIILAPAGDLNPLRSSFKITKNHKFYIFKVIFIFLLSLLPVMLVSGLFLSTFGTVELIEVDEFPVKFLLKFLFLPVDIILNLVSIYLICLVFKNISASDPIMQKQVKEAFTHKSE